MKTSKSIFGLLAVLLCAGVIRPPQASAQYLGTTSPQTVAVNLATNLACTGAPQNFTTGITPGFDNLGQTQHYITASVSGTTSFKAEIDGIDNAGNVFRISDILEAASTGLPFTLSGSGYFTNIRVSVLCSPGSGAFTLAYSGTSGTANVNAGSYLLAQIDKTISISAAANTDVISSLQTPFGNSYGAVLFAFGGAGGPAGSTLQIACTGNTVGINSQTFTLTTPAAAQVFPISPGACPIVQTTYTHGGASAVTYSLEYIFFVPGSSTSTSGAINLGNAFNTTAVLQEKGSRWGTQTSTPAAGTQATTSKTAGAAGVRHVADCVTWSAGAAAAPAATLLTINLRDGGTGAGTIIWQTTINAAATAAQHGNGFLCGLNLIGTAATAMTLEFAAGLANETESVALTGYDVQ